MINIKYEINDDKIYFYNVYFYNEDIKIKKY